MSEKHFRRSEISKSVPENDSDQELERATIRRLSVRVIPVLFLLYCVAFIDRTSLGFAQLEMGEELGLDPAIFGLAAGIFFAGYILLEIPSSIALEKYGTKIWVTRIALTWGIITILTGFVQNETQLIIARILLGAAEAGLAPAVILYTLRLYPRRHRGKATASIFVGSPVAGAIAGPICGVILDNVEWFGLSSWRWIFILTGIPAVLLAIVCYKYVVDRPEDASWLSEKQLAWLINAMAAEPETPRGTAGAVFIALRNPKVLALALVQILVTSSAYGLAFWSPQIVQGLGEALSATTIGFLVFIPSAAGAIAMYSWAALSDRSGERVFHTASVLLVTGIALFAFPILIGDPVVAFLALIVANISMSAYGGPFWSVCQELFSGKGGALSIAAVATLGQVGGLIAPYIFGLLTRATGNTNAGVIYLGAGMVLAFAILAFGHRAWRRPETISPEFSRSGGE